MNVKEKLCKIIRIIAIASWVIFAASITGAQLTDEYEDDDVFTQAKVIVINAEAPQRHNFHDTGDEDWIKFYGLAGQNYVIEASNLEANCDIVIELYDTNGASLLKEQDKEGDERADELLDWNCSEEGAYCVKYRHYGSETDNSETYGENAGYDLQVSTPTAPDSGVVEGRVSDAFSGDPIGEVRIKTDGNASALSMPGEGIYSMDHPPGDTYTLYAQAVGYERFEIPLTVEEATGLTQDIAMIPLIIKKVPDLTFSPSSDTYNTAQSVSISCSETDIVIRYTTDGTDPTESSEIHSSPISVAATTTIRARGYKDGWEPSEISERVYTILLKTALSVTKTGNGTVTSDPPGINCGDDCDEAYEKGTAVTLAAVPDEGWIFEGWSGACTGTEACHVAMDTDQNISGGFVEETFEPDDYEADDTPDQAGIIVLNDTRGPQRHNFHDAGDEDWIKFFGISGQVYTIEAKNLSANCDIVIELYGTDGTTSIATQDTNGDEQADEILDWLCPQEGVYYLRYKNYSSDFYGENTEYDLQVFRPHSCSVGTVTGTVTDGDSGEGIGHTQIRTDKGDSAISDADGAYTMAVIACNAATAVIADAFGYNIYEDALTVSEGGTTEKNIAMTSNTKGDINGDTKVDLADAVLGLKVMAGTDVSGLIRPSYASSGDDVNGDDKVGLEEVSYILQVTSGL